MFLFCVMLAGGFWTFNSLNKVYVYTVACPLHANFTSDTLYLTLQGKGFDLISLLRNDSLPVIIPEPEAYFKNEKANDSVQGEIPSVLFINHQALNKLDLKLVSIQPQRVIPVVESVSMRRVPVKLRVQTPRPSTPHLEPGPIILKPDSVSVYGPYEIIKNITELLTKPAPWPSTPGVTFTGLNLDNPNPDKIRLSSDYAWMYCKVAELTEKEVTLPINTSALNGRYRITTVPAEARVIYQAPAALMQSIDPSGFIVSVKIDPEHSEGQGSLVIEKIPAGVRYVRVVPSTVSCYLIEQL